MRNNEITAEAWNAMSQKEKMAWRENSYTNKIKYYHPEKGWIGHARAGFTKVGWAPQKAIDAHPRDWSNKEHGVEGIDGYFGANEDYPNVASNNKEHGVYNPVKGVVEVIGDTDLRAGNLATVDQDISTADAYNIIPAADADPYGSADTMITDISSSVVNEEKQKVMKTFIPMDIEERFQFYRTSLEGKWDSLQKEDVNDLLNGLVIPLSGKPEDLQQILDDIEFSPENLYNYEGYVGDYDTSLETGEFEEGMEGSGYILNQWTPPKTAPEARSWKEDLAMRLLSHPDADKFLFGWELDRDNIKPALRKFANFASRDGTISSDEIVDAVSANPDWTTATPDEYQQVSPIVPTAASIADPELEKKTEETLDSLLSGENIVAITHIKRMMRGYILEDRDRELAGMGATERADHMEKEYKIADAAVTALETAAIDMLTDAETAAILDRAKKDYGLRVDGTKKGRGFLGPIKMTDGSERTMTELSVGVEIDEKEILIPAIVPILTREQLDHLKAGGEVTDEILEKAIIHAKARIANDQSPFREEESSEAEELDIIKNSEEVRDILNQASKRIFGIEGIPFENVTRERDRLAIEGRAAIQRFRSYKNNLPQQRLDYIKKASKDLLGWDINTPRELIQRAFALAADESVDNQNSASQLSVVNAILGGATDFVSTGTGGSNASLISNDQYKVRLASAVDGQILSEGSSDVTTLGILTDTPGSMLTALSKGDPHAQQSVRIALNRFATVYQQKYMAYGGKGTPAISAEEFIKLDEKTLTPYGLTEYYTVVQHPIHDPETGDKTGEVMSTRLIHDPLTTMSLISTLIQLDEETPGKATSVSVRSMVGLLSNAFVSFSATVEELKTVENERGETSEAFAMQEIANLSAASTIILHLDGGSPKTKRKFMDLMDLRREEWDLLTVWANSFLKLPAELEGNDGYKSPAAIWRAIVDKSLDPRWFYGEASQIDDRLKKIITETVTGTDVAYDTSVANEFFSLRGMHMQPMFEGSVIPSANVPNPRDGFKMDKKYKEPRPQILNRKGNYVDTMFRRLIDFGVPLTLYNNADLVLEWDKVSAMLKDLDVLPTDVFGWVNGPTADRGDWNADTQSFQFEGMVNRIEPIFNNIYSPGNIREVNFSQVRRGEIGLALILNRLSSDPRTSKIARAAYMALRREKETLREIDGGNFRIRASEWVEMIRYLYHANNTIDLEIKDSQLKINGQNPDERRDDDAPPTGDLGYLDNEPAKHYQTQLAMGNIPTMLASLALGTITDDDTFFPKERGVYSGASETLWIDWLLSPGRTQKSRMDLSRVVRRDYGQRIQPPEGTITQRDILRTRAELIFNLYPELIVLNSTKGQEWDMSSPIPFDTRVLTTHVGDEMRFGQLGPYVTHASNTLPENRKRRNALHLNNLTIQTLINPRLNELNQNVINGLGIGRNQYNECVEVLVAWLDEERYSQSMKMIKRAPEGERSNEGWLEFFMGVPYPDGEKTFYNAGELKTFGDVREHFPSVFHEDLFIRHEIMRSVLDPTRVNPLIADIIKGGQKPNMGSQALALYKALENAGDNVLWETQQETTPTRNPLIPETMRDETWFDVETANFLLKGEDFKDTRYFVGKEKTPTIGIGSQRTDEVDAQLRQMGYDVDAVWAGRQKISLDAGKALSRHYSQVVKDTIIQSIGFTAWKKLNNNQRIALIDLGYNMGSSFLDKKFPSMRDALRVGDLDLAMANLQWVNPADKTLGETKYWRGETDAETTTGSVNRKNALVKKWNAKGGSNYFAEPGSTKTVRTYTDKNGWITRYNEGISPVGYVWHDDVERIHHGSDRKLTGTGAMHLKVLAGKGGVSYPTSITIPYSVEKDYLWFPGFLGPKGGEYDVWEKDYAKELEMFHFRLSHGTGVR